jgi:CDGSH-type Zn-finger protein
MSNTTQIVLCKCGAIRAAAQEPFCIGDKDWKKTLARAVKNDMRIDRIESAKLSEMTWNCSCEKAVSDDRHVQKDD